MRQMKLLDWYRMPIQAALFPEYLKFLVLGVLFLLSEPILNFLNASPQFSALVSYALMVLIAIYAGILAFSIIFDEGTLITQGTLKRVNDAIESMGLKR